MIEHLDEINGVNENGDVVPLEDIFETERLADDHEISVRTLAFGGLVHKGALRRLQDIAEHPALPLDSTETAHEVVLGEVAQSILDTYINDSERLRQLGASDHKARIKLMQTLVRGQASRTVSSDEARKVLETIRNEVPQQKEGAVVVDLRPEPSREKPHYRDYRSAAANDYDD